MRPPPALITTALLICTCIKASVTVSCLATRGLIRHRHGSLLVCDSCDPYSTVTRHEDHCQAHFTLGSVLSQGLLKGTTHGCDRAKALCPLRSLPRTLDSVCAEFGTQRGIRRRGNTLSPRRGSRESIFIL